MAGFDEGQIYISNQEYHNEDGDDIENQGAHRIREVERKFRGFFRTAKVRETLGLEAESYSDLLLRHQKAAPVDLVHIRKYDPAIGGLIEDQPGDYLPALERAASETLRNIHHNQIGGSDEVSTRKVQVLLESSEPFGPASMRDLTSTQVSKLVRIPGIVTAASKPKHKATHMTIQCKDCRMTQVLACQAGIGGTMIPRMCTASRNRPEAGSEDAKCSTDPFVVLPQRSKFCDQQMLKLQERPEDVPTGELPRHLLLLADRTLVGTVAPGARVTVTGIYSIYTQKEQSSRKDSSKSGVAVRQPYIRAVSIAEEQDQGSRAAATFTLEQEQEFKDFAAQPDLHQKVFDMMAPQIFGCDMVKKAIACLLFGGSRKRMPDGTHRRGDINVLLLGDPSTAKSQFLKFASNTAPTAVYTSGKGSSAAGLTASVVQDPNSREFYLEGGAMVLADNGVVCIDEFDKMRQEDRVAIHEAMEQQTISIAKAGITTMLKSRTSVLAAANPPAGRYDDLKSTQDNIDLQSTILSRFDLIFIVRDERTQERDELIARHVLKTHANAGAEQASMGDDKESEKFLKRFIYYARHRCSPRLTEVAAEHLASEYVRIRQEVKVAKEKGERSVVPVTVRQLEALVRISEALARMQLQQHVTESHVQAAIQLFNASTGDAIKSGIHNIHNFTDEQRQELHAAEAQILRRVPTGGLVQHRTLVNEMVRVGLDSILANRAIAYLVQQQVLELRGERRLIKRLR